MSRAAPLWAAATTGVQVGAAMVATRYVVDAAGPASLGLWRYLIGLMCLLPVVLLRPWRAIAVRDLLPIGLLGIGQFADIFAEQLFRQLFAFLFRQRPRSVPTGIEILEPALLARRHAKLLANLVQMFHPVSRSI